MEAPRDDGRYRINGFPFLISTLTLTAFHYCPKLIYYLLNELQWHVPSVQILISITVLGSLTITVLYIYYINLPLSHTLFRRKARLVILKVIQLTRELTFDIWVILIITLLAAWILGLKDGIVGIWVLWCIILWIYNLNEEDISENKEINPNESSSLTSIRNSPTYHVPPNGVELENFLFELEEKIQKLERSYDIMASDKVQQSITLYTFEHQLSLRIQALEDSIQTQQQTQFHQSQITDVVNLAQNIKKKKQSRTIIIVEHLQKLWNINVEVNRFILQRILPQSIYNVIKYQYHCEVFILIWIYNVLIQLQERIHQIKPKFKASRSKACMS